MQKLGFFNCNCHYPGFKNLYSSLLYLELSNGWYILVIAVLTLQSVNSCFHIFCNWKSMTAQYTNVIILCGVGTCECNITERMLASFFVFF